MATLKIKDVKTVMVSPLLNKTRVRLSLQVSAANQYESIEFELSSEGALIFASAIQEVLSSDKNPTPPNRGPSGGKPKLWVVK